MASSSEEASNAMSSALEPQEIQPKEVSSGGKDEVAEPEVEDGAVEEDGEGSGESGDEGSLPGDEGQDKTLHYAGELIEKGIGLRRAGDYAPAVDCLSRAVEIHVAHYGELAPECVKAYYEYGRTLLYKAQEEADPLAHVPKKESENGNVEADKTSNGETSECSAAPIALDGKEETASLKSGENGEGSSTPAATDDKQECVSSHSVTEQEEGGSSKDEEEDEEGNEDEDLEEADEDDSDLDLAWKLLDVARAISEKLPEDSIMKVDILSALGEVALEREDIETSLSDYQKALSMLQRLVESNDRHLAELNFRICLVLEVASRTDEALPYCEKAISICRARVECLKSETTDQAGSTTNAALNCPVAGVNLENDQEGVGMASKVKEIETLTELLNDLEKKHEDLQQAIQNPKSILSEIMQIVGSKSNSNTEVKGPTVPQTSSEVGRVLGGAGVDSPTVSTGATSSAGGSTITDLGVVGRGIKRASVKPITAEPPAKKPAVE
ncbi:hypothetical protein H6P81_020986 [Aristolochia fimbriata]|uniref:Nuclear autoantigenic sperm protein n=1 Tax=Aristolochia fimbriata TaxID=158543 RepID=A0AAV7DZ03_ARIFI|nr:hypothetical protein H6P81_020986 [Aristolochia fimbriata]